MFYLVGLPVLWVSVLNLFWWGLGRSVLVLLGIGSEKGIENRYGFPWAVGLIASSWVLFAVGWLGLLSAQWLVAVPLAGATLTVVRGVRSWNLRACLPPFRNRDTLFSLSLALLCTLFFLVFRSFIPPSMMGRLTYHDPQARLFYLVAMAFGMILLPVGSVFLFPSIVDRVIALFSRRPVETSGSEQPHERRSRALLVVLSAILFQFFLFLFVPRFAHDSLAYHLVIPKDYLLDRGITPNRNLFFNMPHNIELLYMLPMVGGGTTAVKLFSFQFSLGVFLTLVSVGERWWGRGFGPFLGLVYLLNPTVQDHLQLAKTENAQSFFVLYTALAFLEWRKTLRLSPLAVFAVFGGWLMGCKYTLWGISFVFFVGAVIHLARVRQRIPVWKQGAFLGLLWGLAVAPWLIKNALFTGNPVYPNLFSLFGGKYWSEILDSQLRHQYFRFLWEEQETLVGQIRAVLLTPWDLVTAKHLRGRFSVLSIGLFLLASWFRESRAGRGGIFLSLALAGYGMWILFPGNESRFLVPLVPLMVLSIAPLLVRWLGNPRLRVWVSMLVLLAGFSQLRFPRTLQLEAMAPTGYLDILKTTKTNRYALWKAVEAQVPIEGRIAVFFEEQVYYLDRPYFYHWFGGNMEILRQERTPERVASHLTGELGATHLLLSWRDFDYYLSFRYPSEEQMAWEKNLLESFLDRWTMRVLDYEDYSLFELIPPESGNRPGSKGATGYNRPGKKTESL